MDLEKNIEIEGLTVIITKDNIKIKNSYVIKTKEQMRIVLKRIFEVDPYKNIRRRKLKDSILEWRTHNILYSLGLFKKHCIDCDISENEQLHRMIAYKFLGRL